MLIRLKPNIFWVEAPNSAKFPYCHTLFIKDEFNILIDTSCSLEDINFLKKENVDIILNTHFHEDHILNNYLFTNSLIYVHEEDAKAVSSLDTFLKFYGFDEPSTLQLGLDFIKALDLNLTKVDHKIKDNEIIEAGKTKLQVIHTPGHTPGHCSFYIEKHGLLFLGDIDLSSFGPWYGHSCSNIDDFITSINKCIEIDPTIALSSHKGVFTDNIKKRLQNYVDIIYMKEELVLKALAIPKTLEELTTKQIFYGNKIILNPLYKAMEKMAITKHLQRLIKLNVVSCSDGIYYLS